jgi:hypothetical protein
MTIEFLGWPPWLALALAAAAVWLALRLRQPEPAALPLRTRAGLDALRIMAVVVLALALAEPALAWTATRREPPAVAIVIDRSGSMALADASQDPGARLDEAIALGLADPARRPDAALRALALARSPPGSGDPARAEVLAAELAGTPALAAALRRLAAAWTAADQPAARLAAEQIPALARRAQAESDSALIGSAGSDDPLSAALERLAAMPRRERALLLARRLVDSMPGVQCDWFVLDERLVPVAGPDGVREALSGDQATDLGEGLAALARGWSGRGNPTACILLSDGRRTAGADPEPAARALAARGVALLAVAIGDPAPPPDAAVAGLEAPDEVVVGEAVRLVATLRVPPGSGAWDLVWLRDGVEQRRQGMAPTSAWTRVAAEFASDARQAPAAVAVWEARLEPVSPLDAGYGWHREVWTSLPTPTLAALRDDRRWPDKPDETAVVAAVRIADARPDRGERLRAWLQVPQDGEYVLWIAGDDACEVRLAEDGEATRARTVCSVAAWTPPDAWDVEPGQRSAPVRLRAGVPAYVEVQLVNMVGPGHVAIGWTRPDQTVERPLPLSALTPWSATGPPGSSARVRRSATAANNAASRAVATAATPRILVLDDAPRWEVRHAMAALEAGLGAQVQRRFRSVLGPGVPLLPVGEALPEVDVVVVGDLPPAELGAEEQARLAAFAANRGGGLIVVSGPRAMPAAYGLGQLADLLPVRPGEAGGLPEPDALAAAGPAVAQVLSDPLPAWDALAPLPWWVRSAVPRPGTDVVLQMQDRSASPLLVFGRHGAGRVAWLGSDQLWRWRSEAVHARLWLRLVRWALGSRLSGEDRRLQVGLDRTVAAPGQQVALRLRADPSLPPPVVFLERLDAAAGRRDLALTPLDGTPATWLARLNDQAAPLEPGRWRLVMACGVAREQRELVVRAEPGREALEPALDRAALDRLAVSAGGLAVGMDGVEQTVASLRATWQPREIEVRRRLTPWDGPWWLLALAALLLAEWTWRRRAGLP